MYILISLLMVLDLLRVTVGTEAFIPAYSTASIVLGLLQGVLLLAAAQGIYFSPSATFRSFPRELAKHRGHAALFGFFIAFVALIVIYSAAIRPTQAGEVTDFSGNVVPTVTVGPNLIALVVGIYIFFLAYPTTLMLLGASKVEDNRMKRSIYGLGVGWAAVSGLYVLTAIIMWNGVVDATGIVYPANAAIFFVIIRNFRRSASLSGFVEGSQAHPTREEAKPSLGMSALTQSLSGKKILYEVDPALPYETTLRQTLEEFAWESHAIFVFTPRASPLHRALTGGTGIKLFLSTGSVSYMTVAEDTHDMLIPHNNTAVFLDAADKILASNPGKVLFVFDNVSDLLLMVGLEKTYKFLKQFLELLHEPRATAFFIFIRKANEPREVNLLKGIFPNHFIEDAEGPRLVK